MHGRYDFLALSLQTICNHFLYVQTSLAHRFRAILPMLLFKSFSTGRSCELEKFSLERFSYGRVFFLWNFASLQRLRSRMLANFTMNNIRRPTHCLLDFVCRLPPYRTSKDMKAKWPQRLHCDNHFPVLTLQTICDNFIHAYTGLASRFSAGEPCLDCFQGFGARLSKTSRKLSFQNVSHQSVFSMKLCVLTRTAV